MSIAESKTNFDEYIREMVEENAKICDLTMDEIVEECKAVRQELYEKRMMAQHGN